MADDASEQEAAMRQAVAAMQQALATPWVRELIEARERSQEEDAARIAQARVDGELSKTPRDEIAREAEDYAARVVNEVERQSPPLHLDQPPYDPLTERDRYRWWLFDRDKAGRDRAHYFANFRRKLVSSYLEGASGMQPDVVWP